MAVGLNYSDHAKETNASIPDKPIFFDKASSAINGPYDDIVLPSNYDTVDYEVELAFVVGRRAKRVSRAEALGYVAGYLICNDVSERTAQKKEGGQWYRAKSFDTFAPIGPCLVTADEVGDPHALSLVCRVDGDLRQNGNTSNFIFDIPCLIEFISRSITLEPGDIIATGTPAGVGVFRDPPVFLQPGDRVRCRIEGIGDVENPVVAWTDVEDDDLRDDADLDELVGGNCAPVTGEARACLRSWQPWCMLRSTPSRGSSPEPGNVLAPSSRHDVRYPEKPASRPASVPRGLPRVVAGG